MVRVRGVNAGALAGTTQPKQEMKNTTINGLRGTGDYQRCVIRKILPDIAAIKIPAERFVQKYCYPLLPYPGTRFLIISNGRTGSNYLASLLLSHPDIYQYGEVIGESYLCRPDIREKIRACGSVRYLRNCYRKRIYKQAVGLKILYYQFKPCYAEGWGINDLQEVLTDLVEDRNILVIHLKRRNRLKTMVSVESARLTNEYVKQEEDGENSEISVFISPEQASSFFQDVKENEKYFDECFRSHRKLEIFYEDLITNTEMVSCRILDFLKLDRCELKSSTLKQGRKPLSERIRNYKELKETFRDTASERYFED